MEVGPGLGALTIFLAQEAGRVVALEVDQALAAYLQRELFAGEPRMQVICQNVLRFDFLGLAREAGHSLVVVGNLPYQITSPLLFKLAAEKAAISRAVLMMQQEVGARLTATPGTKDYGILSVLLQYHFSMTRLFSLGPANFYPPPQVTSVSRKPLSIAMEEIEAGKIESVPLPSEEELAAAAQAEADAAAAAAALVDTPDETA